MSDQKRPRAWFDDDQPFLPGLVVYETAPETVDTGLLDAGGTKIFRRPRITPIGFDISRFRA